MKKLLFPGVSLILMSIVTQAQEYSREFGKVSQDEISLARYARDPSAEAIVLFDIGDSRFTDTNEGGYNIEFKREKRIKIFTKAGVKYAEVSIPFYISENGDRETVKSIEAYSYNWENGQMNRTALNPSTVYEEKVSNRWSEKKFVIPDAKPGSIVEYRFVLESPFHFNLPGWKFQDRIPTVYSKYVGRMIPFYEYAFILQGTNKFDYQTKAMDPEKRVWGSLTREKGQDVGQGVRFQDVVYTYILKDVPAFKDESYITSAEDYLIKLDFQESKFNSPYGGVTEIISTWPKLVEELLKTDNFGKYMKACDKPAKKILETELILTGKKDLEKCQAIINYVKAGFKWDEYGSIYSSKSQKEFINQKKGNPAEINLFLTALLKAAGIDAAPVILSTRDHGKINSNYPFLHYFNYVIVLVNINDKSFLCDATEFYTNFDRIPSRCINDKGLVIREGEVKWINLNFGYNSADNKTVTMEILPESQKAMIRMVLQAVEFDAYWYKDSFSNDTTKLKKHLTDVGFQTINKVTTTNFERTDLPYVISCEGEAEIEQLNDKLIVSPYLDFYPKENKMKQPSRTYPIDLIYANTESFNCKIKIPEGYRVLTMPESFKLDNETARINVSYSAEGDMINIESDYGFKKAVYPASDYSNIRNYFDIIIKKFNEQVVLVKK